VWQLKQFVLNFVIVQIVQKAVEKGEKVVVGQCESIVNAKS
jgi:hypothetical protein